MATVKLEICVALFISIKILCTDAFEVHIFHFKVLELLKGICYYHTSLIDEKNLTHGYTGDTTVTNFVFHDLIGT